MFFDWNAFLSWVETKCPNENSEIPLYDLMGMIGTTSIPFLLYYYNNEKSYSFRTNVYYRILTGPVNGMARVDRVNRNYYHVPKVLSEKEETLVFLITEHEFQVVLIYHPVFLTRDFPFPNHFPRNDFSDRLSEKEVNIILESVLQP